MKMFKKKKESARCKRLHIMIADSTYELLKKESKERDMSMSQIVNQMLRVHYKNIRKTLGNVGG